MEGGGGGGGGGAEVWATFKKDTNQAFTQYVWETIIWEVAESDPDGWLQVDEESFSISGDGVLTIFASIDSDWGGSTTGAYPRIRLLNSGDDSEIDGTYVSHRTSRPQWTSSLTLTWYFTGGADFKIDYMSNPTANYHGSELVRVTMYWVPQ
jgi:hypothetical protein